MSTEQRTLRWPFPDRCTGSFANGTWMQGRRGRFSVATKPRRDSWPATSTPHAWRIDRERLPAGRLLYSERPIKVTCGYRSEGGVLEARNRSLSDWLGAVRTGQVQLPRFQRFEAWSYSQVRSLLESILNDLPIGAMFALQVEGNPPFHPWPINSGPEGGKVSELLLDGQ